MVHETQGRNKKLAMFRIDESGASHWFIAWSEDHARREFTQHLSNVGLNPQEIDENLEQAKITELRPEQSFRYTFEDGTHVMLRAKDYIELRDRQTGLFAVSEH